MYPDVKDESAKRVVIKLDSDPGFLNSNLLTDVSNLLFIIYPGVPNTTAVTKETGQNYGPLKTQFVENLNLLSDARIIHNFSTTLQPWMVGIIVFGAIDPVLIPYVL